MSFEHLLVLKFQRHFVPCGNGHEWGDFSYIALESAISVLQSEKNLVLFYMSPFSWSPLSVKMKNDQTEKIHKKHKLWWYNILLNIEITLRNFELTQNFMAQSLHVLFFSSKTLNQFSTVLVSYHYFSLFQKFCTCGFNFFKYVYISYRKLKKSAYLWNPAYMLTISTKCGTDHEGKLLHFWFHRFLHIHNTNKIIFL